ncbi:MAG: dihydrodipicolinate reductase [Pseudomonadota bacterium]
MRVLLFLLMTTSPAAAFERVESREVFLSLVEGRELVTSGVSLRVGADGRLGGRGFGFRVTGGWAWRDGYFCRTLRTAIRNWAEDCQVVEYADGVVRFTAERGSGDVADLRLR